MSSAAVGLNPAQSRVEELEALGFKQGKVKKQAVAYGEQVEKRTYTKNYQDETVGKIPRILGSLALGILGSIFSGCFANASKDFREFTWGAIKKAAESDEKWIGDKTIRGIASVLTTLGCPALLASKEYRDNTWVPLLQEQVNEVVYIEKEKTTAEKEANIAKLGYNPSDRRSVGEYVKSLITPDHPNYDPGRVEEINGDLVVKEHRRKGISSVLIVPQRDFAKARSMKFWHINGKSIKGGKEEYLAIRAILATRKDITEGWRKLSLEMASTRLKRKDPNFDPELQSNQQEIEEEAKKIRRAKRSLRINTKSNYAVIYGKRDLNNTGVVGRMVKFSDDTEKELKEIYEMEGPKKLPGRKPFEKPVAPPPEEPPEPKQDGPKIEDIDF